MSLIPLVLDLAEELAGSGSDYLDHDFGFGMFPREIYRLQHRPVHRHRVALPRLRASPYLLMKGGKNNKRDLHVGKDGFQVSMDVQQFKPNEITVKTVDNTVVVEAKHEDREDDHGIISRHFVRKYSLPKGYDPQEVVSTLSSDGILTVKAPPPPEKKSKAKERVIHVQQTGPAADSIKAHSDNDNSNITANGLDEGKK